MVDTPVTRCSLSKLLPFYCAVRRVCSCMCSGDCLQTRRASCLDGVWLGCVAATMGYTFKPSFVTAELTCHLFSGAIYSAHREDTVI